MWMNLGISSFAASSRAARDAVVPGAPFLRGINFSGQNFYPGNQWPREEAADYFLGDKSMNVIRLNLKWELLQPTLGGALDSAQVTGVQDQIDRIVALGGYVIVEPHNSGRRYIGATEYIIGEAAEVTSAHFADFWTKLATQFSGPKIIYQLLNEPHDQVIATLVSVQNAAIAAIRAVGRTNLILVSGNGFTNSWGWRTGADNYTSMSGIVDAGNNFAFDVHHYLDDYSQGQSTSIATTNAGTLTTVTSWARTNGYRLFLGEIGFGGDTTSATAAEAALDYVEANTDVWLGWAYWAGGGWWDYNHIFAIDPYASQYDVNNPYAAQAVEWDAPLIDALQMQLLQTYLPSPMPYNGLEPLAPGLAHLIDSDGAYLIGLDAAYLTGAME